MNSTPSGIDMPFEPEEQASSKTFIQMSLILIAKVCICVLVIANNTILVTAICKFKILQTRTNHIILNIAVISSAYSAIILVTTFTAFYTLISYILIIVSLLLTYLCLTSFILVAFLGVDWFILATFNNFSSKYQKRFKWVIAACYVLPLFIFLLFFVAGFHYIDTIHLNALTIYLISYFIMAIINIAKCCRNYTQESLKYAYTLTMSNIFFMMWLPCIFVIVVKLFLATSANPIEALISQIFALIAFIAPIPMTFMLIRRDKNFKISYYSFFKKSVPIHEQGENPS